MHNEPESTLHDLAAAYALGVLSPEEAREFEAHMAQSPEAKREVEEFREAAASMALANASTHPSPSLRSRVLARIGQERTAAIPPTPRRQVVLIGALAASILLAAVGGSLALRYRGALNAREQALAAVETRLADRQAMLDRLLEPQVQLFRLTGQGPEAAPGVHLFWDGDRNTTVLHAFNLPPAPAGQAYQLWLLPADGSPPLSVTVFNSEPDGHALEADIPIPSPSLEFSAAAVTVEPEAGSLQPTSTPILVGQLTS